MHLFRHLVFCILFCFSFFPAWAQKPSTVYVDPQGVLRWEHNKAEAAFFGVNYSTPFAYAYRAHKALNVDLEKAIDQDVYHLARLGLTAFRIHVWDTEISDSVGNILENEHLRLFDYLLFKLKERNIKTLITPIAFWGNGYPERNQNTAGFSNIYNKGQSTTVEKAIQAQERYIAQLLQHVNPYTKLAYRDDPDIIAAEINNEPSHSGPKEKVTAYINRLTAAARGAGWTKPIFYNISQGPYYADAVAKTNVQGFSFQWYPSGLVANRTLQGNFLPHVDRYAIPFDTIPQFMNKTRVVYEFDAGDILQPVMYPAMARCFRGAGFQWATQFAYDPMAIAYANTEYQTHYLNLAYTPAKAISFLIAGKVFQQVPRGKTYGTYPQSSTFESFRLNYAESLSEMNTAQEFYHSNPTQTRPVAAGKLQHVSGVGSSPVVAYAGTGAYFLDKLENGVWRLEVMPDAIHIRDPFARAAPSKEVTRIQYQTHPMRLQLPDLGDSFSLSGLNEGNTRTATASKGSVEVQPGTYLLVKKGKRAKRREPNSRMGVIRLSEFVAPAPYATDPVVNHQPPQEVSASQPLRLQAQVVGVEAADQVTLHLVGGGFGAPRALPFARKTPYDFEVEVPAEQVVPGTFRYRILVQKGENEYVAFPGGQKGSPTGWDYIPGENFSTFVAAEQGAIRLFHPTHDQQIMTVPGFRRGTEFRFVAGDESGELLFRATTAELAGEHVLGFQQYVADKLRGRMGEITSFGKLVIRACTTAEPVALKVNLVTSQASGYAATVRLTDQMQEFEIPLSSLQPAPFTLLPRPYPGFHPFWFQAEKPAPFQLGQVERLELSIGEQVAPADFKKPYGFEVEAVLLKK